MSQNLNSNNCMNIVRRHDPDRFILSLFADAEKREALWVLFAFNYEIAKTREVVSETTIGLIRLQWWRDAITEIYDGKQPRQHEVVTPLAAVIKAYDLPQDLFNDLIYAREFDLEGVAPADLKGLMNYCTFTSAPLAHLTLKILDETVNDTAVVDISGQYAFVGLVRAVPHMLSEGQVMLPQDVLSVFDLSPKKLIDFNKKDDIPKVISELYVRQDAYRNAQSVDFKGKIKSKFLSKMDHMTKLYEAKLKSVDYDVFDKRLFAPPKFMTLRLWLKI